MTINPRISLLHILPQPDLSLASSAIISVLCLYHILRPLVSGVPPLPVENKSSLEHTTLGALHGISNMLQQLHAETKGLHTSQRVKEYHMAIGS